MSQAPEPTRELPPVSFSSLVYSYASSAMAHLAGTPDADPNLARYSIDVLGLLRDKTKGNLDDEEAKLLEALLYETRMKYMEKMGAER